MPPACVGLGIQPVTILPTRLQLPERAGIGAATAQPSALSPVLMRVSEMAQPSALPPVQLFEPAHPSVCLDQSGDPVDAAALDLLSN